MPSFSQEFNNHILLPRILWPLLSPHIVDSDDWLALTRWFFVFLNHCQGGQKEGVINALATELSNSEEKHSDYKEKCYSWSFCSLFMYTIGILLAYCYYTELLNDWIAKKTKKLRYYTVVNLVKYITHHICLSTHIQKNLLAATNSQKFKFESQGFLLQNFSIQVFCC